MLKKGDPKLIRAWTFYDWANSVYPLVISSAIFPIFYEKVTQKNLGGTIDFLGGHLASTEFYSYIVAISYLIVAISSPVLSGIADYSGSKKRFLQFFCFLGAGSCMLLSFFNTDHIILSMMALLFASVGYWGSLVFYNAYLPEIAEPADQDKVSARGFGMGYFGSSLLLILILVLAVFTKVIPHIEYTFLLVGIWWIGFAQITFRRLPKGKAHEQTERDGNIVTKGYRELRVVFKDILTRKQLRRFLGSYFMYNMGVQTVMIMATLFATEAIRWGSPEDTENAVKTVQVEIANGKINSLSGYDKVDEKNSVRVADLIIQRMDTLSSESKKNGRTAVIQQIQNELDHDKGSADIDARLFDANGTLFLDNIITQREELAEKKKTSSLVISILLIQFLGMAGAFIMSRLSRVIGNLKTIGIVIFMWILICYCTYQFVYTPFQFYLVAASVGLVMGGIQSMSRSTYSKMLPETDDHASYFSFFDVSEKIGLAIGTTTFGLIAGITGGIRQSVLSLIVTFVIGFLLLLRVPKSETVH
jgi:MFS-type transporter involved in bile tolerance (Atg22 family)